MVHVLFACLVLYAYAEFSRFILAKRQPKLPSQMLKVHVCVELGTVADDEHVLFVLLSFYGFSFMLALFDGFTSIVQGITLVFHCFDDGLWTHVINIL